MWWSRRVLNVDDLGAVRVLLFEHLIDFPLKTPEDVRVGDPHADARPRWGAKSLDHDHAPSQFRDIGTSYACEAVECRQTAQAAILGVSWQGELLEWGGRHVP